MSQEDKIEFEFIAKKKAWSVRENGSLSGWLKDDDGRWRYCFEKTPEFWSLESYDTQNQAVEAMVEKNNSLNDYRLKVLGLK